MRSLLKYVVLLGDLAILGWMVFWSVTEGFVDSTEAILAILLMALVVLNVYFIISTVGGSDWFSLYLKRKALEEKNKIKALDQSK